MKKDAETTLAKITETYLPVHGRGDESEEEQRRQLCSALAILLDELLREEEEWNLHFQVDAILASIEVRSPGLLDLQGLAIWGEDGNTKQWWEPFSALLHVSEAGSELLDYEIKFADAALGLGKVPYNTHPRGWNCAPPRKWLFVFSSAISHDLTTR